MVVLVLLVMALVWVAVWAKVSKGLAPEAVTT